MIIKVVRLWFDILGIVVRRFRMNFGLLVLVVWGWVVILSFFILVLLRSMGIIIVLKSCG